MLRNMIKNAKKPWFWITDRPLSQPFWYKNYRFFFVKTQAALESSLTHYCITTMAVLGKHSGYISSSSSVKIPKRLAGKDLLLRLDVLFGWNVVWYIATIQTSRNTMLYIQQNTCVEVEEERLDCYIVILHNTDVQNV